MNMRHFAIELTFFEVMLWRSSRGSCSVPLLRAPWQVDGSAVDMDEDKDDAWYLFADMIKVKTLRLHEPLTELHPRPSSKIWRFDNLYWTHPIYKRKWEIYGLPGEQSEPKTTLGFELYSGRAKKQNQVNQFNHNKSQPMREANKQREDKNAAEKAGSATHQEAPITPKHWPTMPVNGTHDIDSDWPLNLKSSMPGSLELLRDKTLRSGAFCCFFCAVVALLSFVFSSWLFSLL
jgi:hypothetical protein